MTSKSAALLGSDRLWRILLALCPALVYIAGRITSLLIVRWVCLARDQNFMDALGSWDGRHLISIAEFGYNLSGRADVDSSPAFFPGMPKLMSLVSAVTGVEVPAAGLLISAVAGIVAAYGLARLAEYVPGLDRFGGLILVAVFAMAPMSIVLSMTYTEALFCAFAVWSLVFLLDEKWLFAGALSIGAGLVRPTGLAVAGVIGIAAVMAIFQRRAAWQTWVGAAIAPLGFVLYVGWLALQLGNLGAWFELQRQGWHSEFDWGAGTTRFFIRTLTDAPAVLDVVNVALMILAVILLVLSWRQKQPWQLLVYSALILIQVLGSDGVMNSKGRLLIPAFTLLIPIAIFLAREKRATAVVATVLLGLTSCWYSAYALIIYGFAI